MEPRRGPGNEAVFGARFNVASSRSAPVTVHRVGGDNTIVLAPNVTFDLTAVDNTTNGPNGLPVISGGGKKLAANNLTIVGNGDTIQRDPASSTPAFRLFDVAQGASLTLKDVTLQGGLAFGSGAAADGGAIYNQGTLTLIGATVQNNTAQGSNGTAGKTGKRSSDGQAGADAAGGGIWSSGTVTLQASAILQNNKALGGMGGEAYKQGDGNGGGGEAFGGGLYEASGSVVMNNATLASNQASGGEGGARLFGYHGISGNGGGASGGGLYLASGTLYMSNDTVQNN